MDLRIAIRHTRTRLVRPVFSPATVIDLTDRLPLVTTGRTFDLPFHLWRRLQSPMLSRQPTVIHMGRIWQGAVERVYGRAVSRMMHVATADGRRFRLRPTDLISTIDAQRELPCG